MKRPVSLRVSLRAVLVLALAASVGAFAVPSPAQAVATFRLRNAQGVCLQLIPGGDATTGSCSSSYAAMVQSEFLCTGAYIYVAGRLYVSGSCTGRLKLNSSSNICLRAASGTSLVAATCSGESRQHFRAGWIGYGRAFPYGAYGFDRWLRRGTNDVDLVTDYETHATRQWIVDPD